MKLIWNSDVIRISLDKNTFVAIFKNIWKNQIEFRQISDKI